MGNDIKIGLALDNVKFSKPFFLFDGIIGLEGEFLTIKASYFENNELSNCSIKLLNSQEYLNYRETLKNTIKIAENDNCGFYIYLLVNGELKQSYFLHNITNVIFEPLKENVFNLKFNCHLHNASKGTYNSWKLRFQNKNLPYNLWQRLEDEQKQGWLEVALNFMNNVKEDVVNKSIIIDGHLIKSENDFYCLLGEVINGPGGYFGRNLNALNDCLYGGFGIELPLFLEWKNHSNSKLYLKNTFDEIINIFNEHGVNVNLK